MTLTPDQRRAVSRDNLGRDTCVVAGPGSGKTTVLVEYFRELVEQGVDPLSILAITFTDKAATHMREKLAQAFEQDPARRARLERAWVSTVHGFCARLLKENAVFAGIDPEFYVADEREAERLQHLALRQAADGLLEESPSRTRTLLRGLAYPELRPLLPAYDAMRGAGFRVEQLRAMRPTGAALPQLMDALAGLCAARPRGWSPKQQEHFAEVQQGARNLLAAGDKLQALAGFKCNLNRLKRDNEVYDLAVRVRELIEEAEYELIAERFSAEWETLLAVLERFDTIYRARKRELGALDYADLEEYAVHLLETNSEVRERIRGQFQQVLMDEFQDTNGQQAKLLAWVRPPDRFYAVGDINQSIYGFRHAEPEVFRAYRDDAAARGRPPIELRENFRSREPILQAVTSVLGGAPGIEERPLIGQRQFPPKAGPSVELIAALGEEAPRIEAQWVARRIVDLAAQERAFRDIAVLVRNTEVLPVFCNALDALGIPFAVNRGRGFYENAEIVDLIHLLRVLANPRDELSLAALLRSPLVRLSDEALRRLKAAGNLGAAIYRIEGLEDEDARKLETFRERLGRWRAARDTAGFDRVLLRAIDETGYECESGARGWANVEKLLAQARSASARMTHAEFVRELELQREANPREPDAPPEDSLNAVRLMTVHAAKGLEFPVVFLAALHKGVDQGIDNISFSPRHGLGARWRHPATGKEKSDLAHHRNWEERKVREAREANRLLYVAMTRAEDHLVLSLAAKNGKLDHWAQAVCTALKQDVAAPRDEVVAMPWPLRVLVTGAPPEPAARVAAETGAEALELARPEVTGQHDTNVNVTSLALFAHCPRKYYLSRYLGFELRGRNGEGGAAELGRQVHRFLAGEEVEDPEVRRLGERFRASDLGRRAARGARVEREFDFLMAIEDMVLRGQIDLWFEEAGEVVLVDYKTDDVGAREARAGAPKHAAQLRFYALALERLLGRPPAAAWLYYLRPDIAVPVDLAPRLLDSPEQLVRELREAQASGTFELREGPHCARCEFYRRLCPARDAAAPAAPEVIE